jgi:hypothetical protein
VEEMQHKFLRGLVALVASGIFLLAKVPVVSAATVVGTKATSQTQTAMSGVEAAADLMAAKTAMGGFLNQYSLTLDTDCTGLDSSYQVACVPLANSDLTNFKYMARDFIEEWSKYPTAWVHVTDLQRIMFVKGYGVTAYTPTQMRAAAPYPSLKTMLYDIGYTDSGNDTYMRHVIHHEFDHYLTYSLTGSASPNDTTWVSYNPSGFVYGSGGASCYQGSCPSGEHAVTGFATGYATSGIEEDMAELYGYLFTDDGYGKLVEWNKSDTALSNKTTYYKNLIKARVPSMDDSYFSSLHPVNTPTPAASAITVISADQDNSITAYAVDSGYTLIVNGKSGDITVHSGGVLKGAGLVKNVVVESGGSVRPGQSPGCLSTGNVSYQEGAVYGVELGGTDSCISYDQLTVNGTVSLGGATLEVEPYNNFKMAKNQEFTILVNDGSDAITGTFKGLPEGTTFTTNGYVMAISYKAGDGNDIALRVVNVPSVPDTGFVLKNASPLSIAAVTSASSVILVLLTRNDAKKGKEYDLRNS